MTKYLAEDLTVQSNLQHCDTKLQAFASNQTCLLKEFTWLFSYRSKST